MMRPVFSQLCGWLHRGNGTQTADHRALRATGGGGFALRVDGAEIKLAVWALPDVSWLHFDPSTAARTRASFEPIASSQKEPKKEKALDHCADCSADCSGFFAAVLDNQDSDPRAEDEVGEQYEPGKNFESCRKHRGRPYLAIWSESTLTATAKTSTVAPHQSKVGPRRANDRPRGRWLLKPRGAGKDIRPSGPSISEEAQTWPR